MILITVFAFIFLFSISSLVYVYKFRGVERYDDFSEYVRKGWPIFTPLNCLLYIFTQKRSKGAILDVKKFPELKAIEDNWEIIRDEAMKIFDEGLFDSTKNPNKSSYYDIGFRTFYKYGWSKFYLKWYGYTHESAKQICPKTVEILSQIPSVRGAMFSMLPPGGKLTRHLDPVAVSLRYHLGLKTPNNDACFINVDGKSYSWRDGDSFLFDETYLHYAVNNSDKNRIILMCDVKRPLSFIGFFISFFYDSLMRATVVPNLDIDKQGLVNRIFMSLRHILAKSKALKQTNKPLYLVVKHTTNFVLLCLLVGILYGVFSFLIYLVNGLA